MVKVQNFKQLAVVLGVLLLGTAASHWVKEPGTGLGYLLGLFGGITLLFVLSYPTVKRLIFWRSPENAVLRMNRWFHVHIAAGVIGPALIVAHSGLHPRALNSKWALYMMCVLVAVGVLRLYVRMHGLKNVNETLHHLIDSILHMHVPLSILMFLTAIVHVIAVHMY